MKTTRKKTTEKYLGGTITRYPDRFLALLPLGRGRGRARRSVSADTPGAVGILRDWIREQTASAAVGAALTPAQAADAAAKHFASGQKNGHENFFHFSLAQPNT